VPDTLVAAIKSQCEKNTMEFADNVPKLKQDLKEMKLAHKEALSGAKMHGENYYAIVKAMKEESKCLTRKQADVLESTNHVVENFWQNDVRI
jgi:hypothetical protein